MNTLLSCVDEDDFTAGLRFGVGGKIYGFTAIDDNWVCVNDFFIMKIQKKKLFFINEKNYNKKKE